MNIGHIQLAKDNNNNKTWLISLFFVQKTIVLVTLAGG